MSTTTRHADTPGVIAPPPLIYFTLFLVGLALDFIWPTTLGRLWVRLAVGTVLAGGAMVLMWFALREFARAGTPVEPYHPTTALVTGGPYRVTRNPIYAGMGLLYAGVAVVANSLWALLFLVPVLAIIRYGVIAREEQYLQEKFGEPYVRYKTSVRRWI